MHKLAYTKLVLGKEQRTEVHGELDDVLRLQRAVQMLASMVSSQPIIRIERFEGPELVELVEPANEPIEQQIVEVVRRAMYKWCISQVGKLLKAKLTVNPHSKLALETSKGWVEIIVARR